MLTRAISSDADGNVNKDDLATVEGMSDAIMQKLMGHGINVVQDLADQAVDDLLEIPGLDREQAGDLIMAARRIVFKEDKKDITTELNKSAEEQAIDSQKVMYDDESVASTNNEK